jgi:predicted NodU family carbamoyl transferase
MRILGISAFYHDSAAALVRDGEVIAAAQEERFTRKKHDSGFPAHAVEFCLKRDSVTLDDLDYVVFYDKPFVTLLETYLAYAPHGLRSFQMAMPLWIREKLFQKSLLRDELLRSGPTFDWERKLLFTEHHLSHAASAFFPSPCAESPDSHHGWSGRMGHDVGGPGPRQPNRGHQGDSLSPLARLALFGLYLLHRIQSHYHALLRRFHERTGCPVIVNTSFNVRGEPIVGSPEDAFRCFIGTEIDVLAVGNCFLRKENQNPALKQHYEQKFTPD